MSKDAYDSTVMQSDFAAIESLPVDTAFEILSNDRHRRVLRCLRTYDGPMALADLADEVTALENGTSTAGASKEDVKDVHISLYHAEIPTLADAKVVEYDRAQETVTPTENAAELYPFLERIDY
jgi:hypothetical protein